MYETKKKIKIVIPLPVLISMIIIAIVIIIVCLRINTSQSNEELFWKNFSQIDDITEIISNDKLDIQDNFKQTNTYTSNGNISFMFAQGEGISKQFNISTSSRYDLNLNRTYSEAILKNGELDVLKISYINSEDIYGVKCDEILDKYVGIQNSNLTEFAKNYGIENFPDRINKDEYINILKLDDMQKQHIANTYLPIIKSYINPENYTKTNEIIEINGTSYETNAYKIELSKDVISAILTECLNTLKSDTETLTLIGEKISKIDYGVGYKEQTNLIQKIDELTENLQIQDKLTIIVYENNEINIKTNINFGSKFNLVYEKIGNNYNLSVDISNQTTTQEENGEVIDLMDIAENSVITMRILINKNITENITTNIIKIIPDINNLEDNIEITINLGNVKNNNITNDYSLTFNKKENEKKITTTINYNNIITKADSVERIEELLNSNTIVANNYNAEQFKLFIKTWLNMFKDKISEKMTILGLEEISNELEKISIE